MCIRDSPSAAPLCSSSSSSSSSYLLLRSVAQHDRAPLHTVTAHCPPHTARSMHSHEREASERKQGGGAGGGRRAIVAPYESAIWSYKSPVAAPYQP
eukprot:2298974-Rhodomonas_salina.1